MVARRARIFLRLAIDVVASLAAGVPGHRAGNRDLVNFWISIHPVRPSGSYLCLCWCNSCLRHALLPLLRISESTAISKTAYMSGAGHFPVLSRIVMPLASPAVSPLGFTSSCMRYGMGRSHPSSGPANGIVLVSSPICGTWRGSAVAAALRVLVARAPRSRLAFMKLTRDTSPLR